MTEKKEIGQSTKSICGGEQEYDLYERSTQVPVVHSVSFGYKDIDTWHKAALGVVEGHIYSRNTNPTVRAFEDKVKELENAEAATSFSSGMAAISNTLGTFLKSGDRVISIKDSYGGTNVIFNESNCFFNYCNFCSFSKSFWRLHKSHEFLKSTFF